MNDQNDDSNGGNNLPVTTTQPDQFLNLLSKVVPILDKHAENKSLEIEVGEKIALKRLDAWRNRVDKDAELGRYRFGRMFWLMAIVVISLVLIAAGLIFIKSEIAFGMLIISHALTTVVGWIGGAGWAERHFRREAQATRESEGRINP